MTSHQQLICHLMNLKLGTVLDNEWVKRKRIMSHIIWVISNVIWIRLFFEKLLRLVGKWSICASMTYGFVFNTTSNEYRNDFTLKPTQFSQASFIRPGLYFQKLGISSHENFLLFWKISKISCNFDFSEIILRWTKMKSLKPRINVGWSFLPPGENAILHANLEWWWCLCPNGSGNCHFINFYDS